MLTTSGVYPQILNTYNIEKAEDHIVFKDFMMFMSGSLKGIAEAFRLPISKGDFPHRFNILDHQNYCGAIPPLHSEESGAPASIH